MTRTFRDAPLDYLKANPSISLKKLSESSGVSYEQMKKVRQIDGRATNVEDARKIASYLGSTLEEFVSDTQTESFEGVAQYAKFGMRLRALREELSDLSQKEWAEQHGFNASQYNNWEKGIRRINIDDATKLCSLYGLTLDAIYRGRLDGVTSEVRTALVSADKTVRGAPREGNRK